MWTLVGALGAVLFSLGLVLLLVGVVLEDNSLSDYKGYFVLVMLLGIAIMVVNWLRGQY